MLSQDQDICLCFFIQQSFQLFPKLHIERWAFDVELLYLAEKANIPIKELSVNWTEIAGSKITPVLSWIQMGRDILLIWFRYTFRIWKADDLVRS